MKSTKRIALIFLPFLAVAMIPLATHAQPETSPIDSVTDVEVVLNNIVRWAQVIFFILAALFIIFAAFEYLTAGGDDEKVKKAKNMLIYAIVAIAVALVAGGMKALVGTFLGTGN